MAPKPAGKNILFCTDFSEHADTAFTHAIEQAKKLEAKLHLFHVLLPLKPCGSSEDEKNGASPSDGSIDHSEHNLIQQSIGALKHKYGDILAQSLIEYAVVAKVGSPDVEIIDYANRHDIDMIILGALGIAEKERVTRIRTAANVSKFAPCQVIVIQKNIQPQDAGNRFS